MSAIHFAMGALVRWTAKAEAQPELLARRSLAAKVIASEGAFEIADRALQLHGGSGYIEDSGLSLLLRDARITRIFEGANDVLLTRSGALEMTSTDEGAAEHEPGASLARLVVAHKKNVAILRQARELHRIGWLWALAETNRAVEQRVDDEASFEARDLGAHWFAISARRGRLALAPLPDMGPIDAIARALSERLAS
jgi:hypothetical protein